MHMRVVAAAAALMISLAAHAAEPPAPADAVLPGDADSLRDLDLRQLQLVRRALSQCWHSGDGGFMRPSSARARACVIGAADRAIEDSHDPELIRFHRALPLHARYDENRAAWYWQKLVARKDRH